MFLTVLHFLLSSHPILTVLWEKQGLSAQQELTKNGIKLSETGHKTGRK